MACELGIVAAHLLDEALGVFAADEHVERVAEREAVTPSDASSYLVLGTHQGTLADDAVPAMTRHDFEAWLDHHVDQPVLVEWRSLSGGEVTDKTSTTGVLRKDGGGEYHAGDAHIDLTDFDAADFGGEEWSLNSLGRAPSSISR